MISILGDILLDIGFFIEAFPVVAGSMARSKALHITPGGASNVAIMAARLGLKVQTLGEVGNDVIGDIILGELEKEGIDTGWMVRSPGSRTPVAGVVVDRSGEAGYIGYPGTLEISVLLERWRERIQGSRAVFADGWIDHAGAAQVVMAGFQAAREAGVVVFFDPGPGNPDFDRDWHREAVRLADVVLATEEEATWLTRLGNIKETAERLLEWGPKLAVIKRGPGGCLLSRDGDFHLAPSFPVEVVDNTGAGDALDAAVMYGYLEGYPLERLGRLANATGAAKTRKRGTGRHMPTREEIEAVVEEFGEEI